MVTRIEPPRKPPLTQWAFTSPHEGVIPHLYIDTRGNITCGAGFLVRIVDDLERYPWHPSVSTARGDWHELHKPGVLAGQLVSYYRRICCARLTTADIQRIFESKVEMFRAGIQKHWKLHEQPELVQIALVDMSFQLGARGLKGYVELHKAVMRRDWSAAARESFRPDAQRSRNKRTAELFLSAALAE